MTSLRVPLLALAVALSAGALVVALRASRGGRRSIGERRRRWVALIAGLATTVVFVEIAEEVRPLRGRHRHGLGLEARSLGRRSAACGWNSG